MAMNKKVDSVLTPITYILYPLPKIAFLPVFLILFGLGDGSKILLIMSVVIFPILIAARDGVREIPLQLFFSMKSLGLSELLIFKNLVLPAVLPKVITALRISIGISISVLFFCENYATTYGIGYYIMNFWAILKYDKMFAGIVILGFMGIIIFKCIDVFEKKLCPWLFCGENRED